MSYSDTVILYHLRPLFIVIGDLFLMQQVDACIANCDQMLRDSEIVIVCDL